MVGVNEVTPLILNIIFAIAICLLANNLLRRHQLAPGWILVVLSSTVFFTPLVSLVFCGMEHTLHLLITIAIVHCAVEVLLDEKAAIQERTWLLVLAPLMTMCRYEGLLLLFVLCCFFAADRRFSEALVLGGVGLLPLVVYGAWSTWKGWYPIPNSVLLKISMPDVSSLGDFLNSFGQRFLMAHHLVALINLSLFMYTFRSDRWSMVGRKAQVMTGIFLAAVVLHMGFCPLGWFYRYEAYLVGLGIFVVGTELGRYFPENLSMGTQKAMIPRYVAATLLTAVLIVPLVHRGWRSLMAIPRATRNIYEQQYQMGLFLKRFYQGQAVVVNDIGAVNYLANIRTLDLWGLGSLETAAVAGHFHDDTERIRALAAERKVTIAIVYDTEYQRWFTGSRRIPSQWIRVGQWKIYDDVVRGDDAVSFYAADLSGASALVKNLRAFSNRLPKEVEHTEGLPEDNHGLRKYS